MIIQEMSNEKGSAPLRAESLLRSQADESKGTEAAAVSTTEKHAGETHGETSRPDKVSIEKTLAQVEEQLANQGVALKFSISEESDDIQVEVRDAHSNKVIRKIPSDEVVHLSRSIKDMAGVFMDKPA